MKRKAVSLIMAMTMALSLTACGGSSDGNTTVLKNPAQPETQAAADTKAADENAQPQGGSSDAKEYKVGIVQYVDDASLNQIRKAIEDELAASLLLKWHLMIRMHMRDGIITLSNICTHRSWGLTAAA